MSAPEWGDEKKREEEAKQKAGRKFLITVLLLFFGWLVIEIMAISTLGSNANETFSLIGPGPSATVKPGPTHK